MHCFCANIIQEHRHDFHNFVVYQFYVVEVWYWCQGADTKGTMPLASWWKGWGQASGLLTVLCVSFSALTLLLQY